MRKWFIVLSVGLLMGLLSACDYRPVIQPASAPTTRPTTTLQDLQHQIMTQMRAQWSTEKFESVEINAFEKVSTDGFAMTLWIKWDSTHGSATRVTLIPAAQRYYLGTLRVEGKPLPVNLVLAFE